MAFGGPSARTCGEAVREVDDGALEGIALISGVAVELSSVVGGGVAALTLVTFAAGAALLFSTVGLSGRANCEAMIAGSTGTPLTVDCPVGGRRAGGVYLLLEEDSGGNSCLRTPLYLYRHQQQELVMVYKISIQLTCLLHLDRLVLPRYYL